MLQAVVNGIVNGGLLALMTLGLSLIINTSRIPNFAHGGFFTWGAFITYSLITVYRIDMATAVILSILSITALGAAVERTIFRFLRGAKEETIFVAATGLLIAFTNGALLLWGDWPRTLPNPLSSTIINVVEGVSVTIFRLIILVVVALSVIVVSAFLKYTRLGKAIRAVYQDTTVSRLVGINSDRIILLTFALGTAMAGSAGSLAGLEFAISFDMGIPITIKAFLLVIVGGTGSLLGTVTAAIAFGVIDSLTITYITSVYNNAVVFAAMMLILFFRPQGIFGREVKRS
jgi:branched-chain amino acid transport system permease protein